MKYDEMHFGCTRIYGRMDAYRDIETRKHKSMQMLEVVAVFIQTICEPVDYRRGNFIAKMGRNSCSLFFNDSFQICKGSWLAANLRCDFLGLCT